MLGRAASREAPDRSVAGLIGSLTGARPVSLGLRSKLGRLDDRDFSGSRVDGERENVGDRAASGERGGCNDGETCPCGGLTEEVSSLSVGELCLETLGRLASLEERFGGVAASETSSSSQQRSCYGQHAADDCGLPVELLGAEPRGTSKPMHRGPLSRVYLRNTLTRLWRNKSCSRGRSVCHL